MVIGQSQHKRLESRDCGAGRGGQGDSQRAARANVPQHKQTGCDIVTLQLSRAKHSGLF